MPSHDDRHLFELLTLEGAQAGLSWSTILNKRDGYRAAFAGFDPAKVVALRLEGRRTPARRPGDRSQPAEGRVDRLERCTRARDTGEHGELRRVPLATSSTASRSSAAGSSLAELPAETPSSRARSPAISSAAASASSGRRSATRSCRRSGSLNDHTIDCFRFAELREMTAPIRYARSGDVNIAYQVTGEGPFDLVLVPGFFSHLEIDWEHPTHARFLERLGSFARLIRFDKRGTGLSDRAVGLPDFETRMDDVRAVMDAVGSDQAALFGYSEGGPMSVLFAATYPQRTARARPLRQRTRSACGPDDDYPWAPTWEERAAGRSRARGDVGRERRPLDDGPERRRRRLVTWFQRRGRAALSPAGARDLILMNSKADVRERAPVGPVPDARPPPHRRPRLRVDEGRYIAARIPGARFVELDRRRPRALRRSGSRSSTRSRSSSRASGRLLTPIACCRRFSSPTSSARRRGPRSSATRRGPHSSTSTTMPSARELARFSGEEIDTAGDGFLALFDGPARAIRCALAVRAALRRRWASTSKRRCTRARSSAPPATNRAGIAVHVGARIVSLASAGEVLVSSTTRDLVEGSGLEFDDRGEHELKGIEGPRRLFAASEPLSARA